MDNNMTFIPSIDLRSLWRDFKKNIWLIVLAGLVAFMGTYIASHSVYTPTYTSSATLVVRAKVGTSGAYTNLSVSSEMAKIFTEVFKQPTTGQLAAEHLGEETFSGRISASMLGETNLIKVSVTADDPEHAYRLLCAVLEIYPDLSSAVFSNAVIDIMLNPEMPTAPSNYISNARVLTYMMLAGCFEFGLIVFISFLRDTVKNEKIYTRHVDAKLLGTIAHEKQHLSMEEKIFRRKRALLISDGYASLKFSEDYQKIATKMEHNKKLSRGKVFAITSVSENEGKSTAAANIAIALAERGHRVALLDFDIRKPSIFKIFECRKMQSPEIADLFRKTPEVTSDLLETFRYKTGNLYLFMNTKSHKANSEWVSSKLVSEWVQAIAEKMDFVILDTAPLAVSADAVSLGDITDQTILVVRTDYAAIGDVNDAVMTINSSGGVLAGCILNDVHKSFTFFGQIGTDAGGYEKYRYGSYRQHGVYERKAGKKPGTSSDKN